MNALDVAKYVINYALENNSPISNLQLQKILYFLDGEYFSKKGEFLLDDEFAAYPLGPVHQRVYQIYKGYGASKIFDRAPDVQLDENVDKSVVDNILGRRVRMPANILVDESHEIGKAWDRTVKKAGMYQIIDKNWMKEDFS